MTKNPSSRQHVLLVEFRIRPAFIGEFESAILHNAAMSLENEAGCRRFDVCRDPQDSALFFLYEIYDDQAAIDAHMQSPHYLAFNASSQDWVEQKTVRKMLLLAPNAPIS
ncbi:putative quinol monooxygenase [Pollutimonas sp. H1-120]|uniref:putative quinol monooxygenase n=1 Tax=Pollutimonas sp. H1-120 TaxID=3148824 RepID=UPI003B52CCA0